MSNSKILFLISISAIFWSCTKNNDSKYLKSEGVLLWTGDYAVDGCGFFITIDDHKYKPENESFIDETYKSERCNVVVVYQLSDHTIESACGDSPTLLSTDGIKIISISRN